MQIATVQPHNKAVSILVRVGSVDNFMQVLEADPKIGALLKQAQALNQNY